MAGDVFNSVLSDPWQPTSEARPMAQASGSPASMFQSAYAQLLGMGRKTPLAGSMPASMGGGAMPGTTPQAPLAAGGSVLGPAAGPQLPGGGTGKAGGNSPIPSTTGSARPYKRSAL